uniref:Uncharacterized protein n=1 Tax=Utricularia reniformis TaxID=192314 RepID=A0A1Y0AZF7_9LAMI|nr:hypothetical protein AEK19_MT0290 [Utricularia reniformis]ART30566.1 hypothetical protein AEK19_MT0290 [Utricularia reniformis]
MWQHHKELPDVIKRRGVWIRTSVCPLSRVTFKPGTGGFLLYNTKRRDSFVELLGFKGRHHSAFNYRDTNSLSSSERDLKSVQ